MRIEEITKENGIITITVEDGRTVIINPNEKEIISYSGRKVKSFPSAISFEDFENYIILRNVFGHIPDWNRYKVVETLWNDLDLYESMVSEIPKGYIKFLRDFNKKVNRDTLNEFYIFQKTKNFNENDQRDYMFLAKNFSAFRLLSLDDAKLVIRCYRESRKNYDRIFDLKNDVFHIIDILTDYREEYVEFVRNNLDAHRDCYYNYQNIKALEQKEYEKQIINTENAFRKITELSNDKLIIVVPESLDDFTKEGNMQHNCVGYMYHKSIAKGQNFIYFIRFADKPNKSYVTCRLNIRAKETMEYKKIHNSSLSMSVDRDAFEMIEKVDEMIRKMLKKEEAE